MVGDAKTVRASYRVIRDFFFISHHFPSRSLCPQNTDPHYEMILYNVMLAYGRRSATFLRSQKRWQPLLPLLMDHVRNDLDPEVDDAYYGVASGSTVSATRGVAVPIEAKLRSLSVRLLYEVCRMQKMSLQDLRMSMRLWIWTLLGN